MRSRDTATKSIAPRRRCCSAAPLWLLGGLLAMFAVSWSAGLRINLTKSLPLGLYRIEHGAPTRGALVLACLPPIIAAFAHKRGYVARGGRCSGGTVPIGKAVMAVPGDTVIVTAAGVQVNGEAVPNSRPLVRDRHGRPILAPPLGIHHVDEGQRWLFATSPRSFDSRYFGPISEQYILTVMRPVWTIRADGNTK